MPSNEPVDGTSKKSPLTIRVKKYLVEFDRPSSQIHQMLSGGTSASITRFLTQPLDVIKIRFQVQTEPLGKQNSHSLNGSKYTTITQATRLIFKEEGIRAFWKGHIPGQQSSIIYGVCQFWIYEQLNRFLRRDKLLQANPNFVNFVSGGFAGAVSCILASPHDVIKTRLITQDHDSGYKNQIDAFKVIWRTEGYQTFFKGTIPCVVQSIPYFGINFMLYRYFGNIASQITGVERTTLPAIYLITMGAVSGLISKAIVYPFDLIKKRLQIDGFEESRRNFGQTMKCSNIWNCFKQIVQREGLRGLYKGIAPTLQKSTIVTAVNFCLYDKILQLLEDYNK